MNSYIVIDIETSGLSVSSGEIIKIAALKIVNGKIAGRVSSLVKPSKSLDENVEKLTGITNAELDGKCAIIDLLPDFLLFIGDNLLVGHNVEFGVKFINAALNKAGMPPLKNETVDTFSLAKAKCETEEFGLYALAKSLGVEYKNLPETEVVFLVYEKLKNIDEEG